MTRSYRVSLSVLCIVFTLGIGVFEALLPSQASPSSTRVNVPDAFLPEPAQGLSGLLAQVQSDPTIRRRYAAYFHVPESRVAAYMRANLIVSHLTQTGLYTVYFVRPNGLIYPTMLSIPKGSPVFALKGGKPVMTCREGSPLTRYQTAQEIHVVRASPSQAVVKVAGSEQIQIIVPNQVHETVVSTVEQTPIYQPTASDTDVGASTTSTLP